VSSWWRACKGEALPRHWKWYESWIVQAVRSADMLVAPTGSFLNTFRAIHGGGRQCRVIANGRSTPVQIAIRKTAVVLAAGRLWDEAKNIAVLACAAAGTDLRIRLAGEEISPDGGCANFDGVEFLGRLSPEGLLEAMRLAAVFAAPSRYEPFGLSVLEAARCGCALVLADIPTFRELWSGAATFVAADDVQGWRAALSALISDPALAETQGHAARERSLRYSAEAMADAYGQAYSQLMAELPIAGVAA